MCGCMSAACSSRLTPSCCRTGCASSRGVVDTEDLPLNVSREMLQATPVLARIRRAVTNRVLTELKTRAKDAESYAKFWENFGAILKEGIWGDSEHRAGIAELLRFKSSLQEGWISLADYVSRMKPGQEAVYFLAGDDHTALAASPQLEGFTARGIEVLLLSDSVDAFWPERLENYAEKPLRSVTQGAADLSSLAAPETGEPAADLGKLIPALKAALGEAVDDVRPTGRLVSSAAVLSAKTAGPDLQMQRLMRRAGRKMPELPPVLEINPRHRLIAALAAKADAGDGHQGAGRNAAGPGPGAGWRDAPRSGRLRPAGRGSLGALEHDRFWLPSTAIKRLEKQRVGARLLRLPEAITLQPPGCRRGAFRARSGAPCGRRRLLNGRLAASSRQRSYWDCVCGRRSFTSAPPRPAPRRYNVSLAGTGRCCRHRAPAIRSARACWSM